MKRIGPIAQFWLERTPDKREVSGSSPLRPTNRAVARAFSWLICYSSMMLDWGYSSVGRAPGLQPGGHRFEPGYLHDVLFFDNWMLFFKANSSKKPCGLVKDNSCLL